MTINDKSVEINWNNVDTTVKPLFDVKDASDNICKTEIISDDPFRFKKPIRRVAVLGAGPAGVRVIKLF